MLLGFGAPSQLNFDSLGGLVTRDQIFWPRLLFRAFLTRPPGRARLGRIPIACWFIPLVLIPSAILMVNGRPIAGVMFVCAFVMWEAALLLLFFAADSPRAPPFLRSRFGRAVTVWGWAITFMVALTCILHSPG